MDSSLPYPIAPAADVPAAGVRARTDVLWPGMVIAFVLTFVVRWLTVHFVNDHFTHLSRAQQIVMGEWPIRDFFDPGQFLHYYMSAAALLVFGDNLFGEALLTISFIALSAALTFGLAARVSRSQTLGAYAALISVAGLPRLYNYPKIFLYVAALWLAWWYAARPTRGRVVVLAAFCVLSFLFRYDHGLYLSLLMVALLTFVHFGHWREWITSGALFAGAFLLCVLPYVGYVQWAVGLSHYVTDSKRPVDFVTGSMVAPRRQMPFAVDRSAPLLTVHPYVEPRRNDDDRPTTIEGIIDGLDRRTPIFRTTLLPGFFSGDNAQANARAWFYSSLIALPMLAGAIAAAAWWRGALARSEAAAVGAGACLCFLIGRTLIQNNPDARLADVVSPISILGVWMAGRWLYANRPVSRGSLNQALRVSVVTVICGVTLWSVTTQAEFMDTLRVGGLFDGPKAILEHAEDIDRWLHLRPIDAWETTDEHRGLPTLAHYVMRCTSPNDRLMVAGFFAPETYFYTERMFAGGQVHFMYGWHDTAVDQQLTVDRLRRQSVPVILMGQNELRFNRAFKAVAEYVNSNYIEAGASTFGGSEPWRVLVDPRRPVVGTDPELGLPCYRPLPEE